MLLFIIIYLVIEPTTVLKISIEEDSISLKQRIIS